MPKKLPLIVKELLLNISFYGFVVEIIIVFITKETIFYSIGFVVGLVIAIGMCIHMYQSLDDAIDMGEFDAPKHIKKTYVQRTIVVLAAMVILHYLKAGSILTGFIGIMGLKVAAYLQPITHIVIEKYKKRGR